MHPPIKLYNTAKKEIAPFVPINKDSISIYSCGPTVYHYAHIGNLRAYIFADVLRRMFINSGYAVTHVINITDVGHLTSDGDTGEDKLEKGSRREGKFAWEVAAFYEDAFKKDLTALGIPLDVYMFPRATDNIEEQIALISTLEEKGYTYVIEGDGVYFDTAKFDRYRDLANLDLEGLRSGARVEENKNKRSVSDFALWKFSKVDEKRQMEWSSPWGTGFPGWHIECSAMSMKYLGEHFDIHTGGIDHIPVHHTNEIAQSECATGVTYVNYWMHVNFLHDKTGKMSKSNDDFLTLSALIEKGYDPMIYRYFILTAHYRKELSFSHEALQACKMAYNKLSLFVTNHSNKGGVILGEELEKCIAPLQNDVGTPETIASMWKLLGSDHKKEDIAETFLEVAKVLGFIFKDTTIDESAVASHTARLISDYKEAKLLKNYTLSDTIREKLRREGITPQDNKDGTITFLVEMEAKLSGSSSLKANIDTT